MKKENISKDKVHKLLRNRSSRSLHRIGTLLGGFWLVTNLLRFIWPEPDQISTKSPLNKQIEKIKQPNQSISLLLLEINQNNATSSLNFKSEKKYKLKGINMMILNKKLYPEIFTISPLLSVNIPGESNLETLEYAFQIGGIALVNDIISNILNLPKSLPQRYIVGQQEYIKELKTKINLSNSKKLLKGFNISKTTIIPAKLYRLSKQPKYYLISQAGTQKGGNLNTNYYNYNHDESLNIKSLTKKTIQKVNTNLSYKEFLSINAFIIKRSGHSLYKSLILKTD